MAVLRSLDGVKVAVYEDPLPLNELRLPPIAPTSPTAKPVTASLAVNVKVKVASLVNAPEETEFDPSDAVIVIIGLLLSFTDEFTP